MQSIEKFFRMKDIKVRIEYEYVSRFDYQSIVERLNSIIDKNPDCCFDLTGGKELVLVAMGQISAARNIPMFQFDLKNQGLVCVSSCNEISKPHKENISIDECVTLNGGAVVKSKNAWNMDEDFCEDIYSMWDVCRNNIGTWNDNSSALASMEKKGLLDNFLNVSCRLKENGKNNPDGKIMQALSECGVIKDYKLQKGNLSFRYKNEQVRRCLTKSGNVLELLSYMIISKISAENGNVYNDIDVGVMVDWDGIIHKDIRTSRDTRNEIDVFLMRGHIPVFISCKNGAVSKEALYELESVADKFGGEFSKKVLLTTYINRNSTARNFIIQRAKDMKIEIIDGLDKLEREEIKKLLISKLLQA